MDAQERDRMERANNLHLAERSARRAERDAIAKGQLTEKAICVVDCLVEFLKKKKTDAESSAPLRKAVIALTRQCGGVLPTEVRSLWKAVDTELTVEGDLGRMTAKLTRAVDEFKQELSAAFDLPTPAKTPANNQNGGGKNGNGTGKKKKTGASQNANTDAQ